MKLGEMIQHLRKEKGYSQEEFAKLLKIGRSTLANYEQCKRNPNYDTIEKIAKELNVNPAYLMGWDDSKNKNKIYNSLSITSSDKWALYLSGIYQTYIENEDLCYKWQRRTLRKLKNQLQELEEMQFEFNIPFHDYGEEMEMYKDGLQEYVRYVEHLIYDLEDMFRTLDNMYYEDYNNNSMHEIETTGQKRKLFLNYFTIFRDEKEMHKAYYSSLTDEEIEIEFNKLIERLQHENDKFKVAIEQSKQIINDEEIEDIEPKNKINFLKMFNEQMEMSNQNKDKDDKK